MFNKPQNDAKLKNYVMSVLGNLLTNAELII